MTRDLEAKGGGGPARHPSRAGTCPPEEVRTTGPPLPPGGDRPLTNYLREMNP